MDGAVAVNMKTSAAMYVEVDVTIYFAAGLHTEVVVA